MKNVLQWIGIIIPMVFVFAFVVWLFIFAWKFFLALTVLILFVTLCEVYFDNR